MTCVFIGGHQSREVCVKTANPNLWTLCVFGGNWGARTGILRIRTPLMLGCWGWLMRFHGNAGRDAVRSVATWSYDADECLPSRQSPICRYVVFL